MAMVTGDVQISALAPPPPAPAFSVTKSGMAESFWDWLSPAQEDQWYEMMKMPGGKALALKSMRGLAQTCRMLAGAIVQYIQNNATANVGGAVAGLQKSTAVGNPTDATGGATINLPIT